MEIKKVLVIGATGMIGKPVTHELIKAGFDVSLLARDTSAAQKEFGIKKIFNGDIRNVETLHKAMKGQDAVYINLSVKRDEKKSDYHPEQEGLNGLLDVAKKEGIKRIAYLSSLVMRYNGMNGFSWWVFDIKNQAVKEIKASGIPYTIFYPSNFMESLNNLYKSGSRLLLAGECKAKMYFIAGKDFGKTVAAALKTEQSVNKDYAVQGTEAYTADEAVAIFKKNYSKEKLKISKAPLFMLKMMAPFSTGINYGVHIIEALNNYPEKFESESTWKELHKPEISVADYVGML
jgi:uncharacterized protein YbjT (DUF2867 family)